jgi:hypothetical protein
MAINTAQRIMRSVYGGGDFAHIDSVDEARTVGDTLFLFLFLELSEAEDCHNLEEARRRVGVAITDLTTVWGALDKALNQEWAEPPVT